MRFRLIFLFVVIAAVGGYFVVWAVLSNRSNDEELSYWEFFSDLDRNVVGLIIEGSRIETQTPPLIVDGKYYLSFDTVQAYIDETIFWDGANRISITTRYSVRRIDIGRLPYTLNGRERQLEAPVILQNGIPYLPVDFLADIYPKDISFKEYINTVVITDNTVARLAGNALEDGVPLRFEPDRRSPVQRRLGMAEQFSVFGSDANFSRVLTEDGLIGYVETNAVAASFVAPPPAPTPAPVFNGNVVMVWDLVTNTTITQNIERLYAPNGLNVISPSFFEFCFERLDGTLLSVAYQGYVDWAHANGLQVWPMIADFSHTHRVTAGDFGTYVLANTAHREFAIDQIVMYTERYSFDGINIDFENIRRNDGVYYTQFLRELAPLLRERGVILSVCKFVPMPHTAHYNRAATAQVADFIVIMAYDEHYATSRVAGPNASIGFVERGITATMAEVPAHQIILGIPFYVRIWRETETADGIVVTQRAVGMEYAYNIFTRAGATFEWCDVTMSYYASYRGVDENSLSYVRRVWLEDERSIGVKLQLAAEHGLAGAAGWMKGLERPAIWDVLYAHLF